jgi:hypothetical protein
MTKKQLLAMILFLRAHGICCRLSAPQAAPRAGPGLIKGVIRSGLPQIYKILLVRKR